ncbi:MAG: hypothetical protein AAFR27_09760 [Pseudomonadota bacterium]
MSEQRLIHATCIGLDGQGVLITGGSGAGKTQTGLAIYRRAMSAQVYCGFISDDQTLLQADGDPPKLTATCPANIYGKLEVFGHGIIEDPSVFIERAVVTLVANLVVSEEVARMAPDDWQKMHGVDLPQMRLPREKPELAATAIIAAICGHARL